MENNKKDGAQLIGFLVGKILVGCLGAWLITTYNLGFWAIVLVFLVL